MPYWVFMQVIFPSVREAMYVNLFPLGSFGLCVFCSAYCGGLWLASLCVMCKMAKLVDNEEMYKRYRDILDRGSDAFDKLLWNGEFKHPIVAPNMYIERVHPVAFSAGLKTQKSCALIKSLEKLN